MGKNERRLKAFQKFMKECALSHFSAWEYKGADAGMARQLGCEFCVRLIWMNFESFPLAQGPTTYAYLLSRGLLRSFHVHKNNVGEVVPVDTVRRFEILISQSVTQKSHSKGRQFDCRIGVAGRRQQANASALKSTADDLSQRDGSKSHNLEGSV
jgi:hypothetical protein